MQPLQHRLLDHLRELSPSVPLALGRRHDDLLRELNRHGLEGAPPEPAEGEAHDDHEDDGVGFGDGEVAAST